MQLDPCLLQGLDNDNAISLSAAWGGQEGQLDCKVKVSSKKVTGPTIANTWSNSIADQLELSTLLTNMYNRYIPPPKGAVATNDRVIYGQQNTYHDSYSTPQRDEEQHVAAKKITFDDANHAAVDRAMGRIEDVDTPSTAKKVKISKKGKTRDPAQSEEDLTMQGQEEVEAGEDTLLEEATSKKRKRKEKSREYSVDVAGAPEPPTKTPKKEKKKKKTVGVEEEGVDEIHRRHRSVFEKIGKTLQRQEILQEESKEEAKEEEPEEVHDLGPIPQPEPVVFDESKLTYDTLPAWLSSPMRVTRETRCAFSALGIPPKSIGILQAKGFRDAFAVQAVAIPLLTPAVDRQGDVVVSAPTGSGKTLSYVLPMVRDVSQSRVTRLRAVIVLPTRDLVQQVQATCEACAAAFATDKGKRVKIGTAVGNKPFKVEQEKLIKETQEHDVGGHAGAIERLLNLVSLESSDDKDDELSTKSGASRPLLDHVIQQSPDVDILICTPGRLVEHIIKTRGFTLDYVRWLVVDEADKLLAQDYQQWLDLVISKLSTNKPSYRDFPNSNKTGPRKVVLSATMTRDLSLLNGLKLSRPQLVVLEGTKSGEHLLPASLKEYAVQVQDPGLKPLYLVDLLSHINKTSAGQAPGESKDQEDVDVSGSASESDSDSDSSASSDSDSDSDSELSSSNPSGERDSDSEPEKNTKQSKQTKTTTDKFQTTVLIFTKSNEAALRLSRLLAILEPDLAPLIGTLTSSTKTSKRAHILSEFARGKQVRILVASDLVSRGIDLTNLDHVVNYDLPTNGTSYVHRVGRTARAGRVGYAWTLYEFSQGRRFWRDFVGQGEGATTDIIRTGKVERLHIGREEKQDKRDQDGDVEMGGDDNVVHKKTSAFSEERVKAYEAALEQLGKEARG